jgi:hypothetical protein
LQGVQEYPAGLPLLQSLQTIRKIPLMATKSFRPRLRTCWLLLLEEYGVTFEYLPEKKNVVTFADALSRLDIDSLEIQEEEVLILLSGSENNSISNIKLTIPMHTDLIFKNKQKSRKED